MAFYFSNKLSVEIEDKQYTIDLSTNKVIEAINEIRNKSIVIAQIKEPELNDIQNYVESMQNFIEELLGKQSFEKIFKDRVIDFNNIAELVQYLLAEIEKFKIQKLNKIVDSNTPEKLN
ncbi:hypothetical protein [Anaerorhabdus furcosa]|uniref:Uncharacterized protein n=1 Tax=Anaerorhabdus furcosa TaxID=118967 RepID=A0A1T4LQR2_9FIRM|nr:hypothetical protein [Anaerorhabdus furcosa]SJZ56966.1 hypothetical protein SAMN02745191_1006 [Anaerorhabdus furcosa]